MTSPPPPQTSGRRFGWLNRTVLGIALATAFSDFSHEMVTAVLPLYLAKVGLGASALGLIEGIADFLVSMSKLAGGYAGHLMRRKKPVTAAAYLITALGTTAIAFVQSVYLVLTFRSVAWMARGFRGPLRDHLLADAVEPTHYGRAYGIERAADMLGAVAGPLAATLLVFVGLQLPTVILVAFIPGLLAAASLLLLARERPAPHPAVSSAPGPRPDPGTSPARETAAPRRPRFPRTFWLFLIGVTLFGLGDFSRTFLILIAAGALGDGSSAAAHASTLAGQLLSVAVLLYALHNLISAAAAYPAGQLGDRFGKRRFLVAGYGLGVLTNLLLALAHHQLGWVVLAIAFSGIYIAVEETLEKATVAELLPRELKSLGFGILAAANAVGDMASSIYVGLLIDAGRPALAFAIAAGFGAVGVTWMLLLGRATGRDRADATPGGA
ncbi:MAG: MFS transporter [Tepidisphaerales bacterium]